MVKWVSDGCCPDSGGFNCHILHILGASRHIDPKPVIIAPVDTALLLPEVGAFMSWAVAETAQASQPPLGASDPLPPSDDDAERCESTLTACLLGMPRAESALLLAALQHAAS